MRLAPGLHRIGDDVVAAYLVVTDDGVLVVDAGMPGHWRDLNRELATLDLTLADVRGVVLTHGDTDHLGFAERLRRDHGVPVHVHTADAARAQGRDKPHTHWDTWRLAPTARFLALAVRKGGLRTTYLRDVVPVGDGDVLDLPGSPRVVALPGHSPGSIAVHVPAVDAVLVGDALTTRHVLTGRTGPQPAPFTDDPDQALTSLDRLTTLDATWVLPGHGAPSRAGTGAVVAAVRAAAGAELR
ncbi:MBL fold metallo-hydrolase [Cellulomonas bogoriensis]|uniref:Beta-lactamase n=1 Tax=Cellulomonas bogoriensis 69B4 = DSM 16987 TaxID=1386082 RepID=A0A0A0BWZ9_9CELL|nr:MBL fold metallo-hydrolase [Cellulomonas bogoriensis]KGM12500.1 beta-lactamase [Cellulomonas bogoriensis 69B4 = DSM 16987]